MDTQGNIILLYNKMWSSRIEILPLQLYENLYQKLLIPCKSHVFSLLVSLPLFPVNTQQSFRSWRTKPECKQNFTEVSPAFHQKPNCVYFTSEVTLPNSLSFSKISRISVKATRNRSRPLFLQKDTLTRIHTHSRGIQPGLQIFKLEEILSQRTNIYREGIQVGFPHVVPKF